MHNVEDGLEVLEEGVVDDLDFDAEMEAQGVQNASSLHLRRISCYLVVVVFEDLGVNIVPEKLLSLLGLDKQQIKKIYKALLELM